MRTHACAGHGLCYVDGCPSNVPELAPDASEAAMLAWLERDGGAVPCSRYGRNSADCAPVAVAMVQIVADATGDAPTYEDLHYAMGLVVNDHDDPQALIEEHGTAEQRAMLEEILA